MPRKKNPYNEVFAHWGVYYQDGLISGIMQRGEAWALFKTLRRLDKYKLGKMEVKPIK